MLRSWSWLTAALAFVASAASAAPLADSHPLPNGIEAHLGSALVRVTALRPDVLRLRIAPGGALSDDGSWAVLPQARSAVSAVTALSDGASVGFSTSALAVRLSRESGVLTVTDPAGRVIWTDAPSGGLRLEGQSFRLRKTLPSAEHDFGLGDKAGPLDHRGRSFVLWNTDAYGYQEGEDPLYKSIPFFVGFQAGKAYGVFLDNTFRSHFDFGKDDPDTLSFGADGGPIDVYLMAGPSPKDVESQYAWLTGPTPLPPLWALGWQQSRYSYATQAEAQAIVDRYRAERIPLDVLWLDIDYQDRNRPFTVDPKAFPDMAGFISAAKTAGVRAVLITDLHIADAPGQGYAPFETGLAGDHFLKESDGRLFVGPVWPGPSVFPEFTRAATRAWWGGLYKDFYAMGAAGFWNDMNEPAVFNAIKTIPPQVKDRIDEPGFVPRTTDQREIHNVFGALNARATFEGLLKLNPQARPFVMTRAAYAGAQRYAVTWTGDNSSNWSHLRLSTPMLESLGLSGFALAGDDLGGFAGSPPADLLTRWIEVGVFNPIARDHTVKGSRAQEPWVDGAEQTAIRRRYIEERYRLLPYSYTLAEETSRTGVPMMRPLFLEFPDAAAGEPLDLVAPHEFLWGGDLLVAPPPFAEQPAPYEVILPPGGWYDYWTGRRVGEGPVGGKLAQHVEVKPELAVLPVYVRAGAIIPRQPLVQSTSQTPTGALRLDVYPGPDCRGGLYQDAGDGYGYRSGDFYRTSFRCSQDGSVLTIRRGSVEGRFRPWWSQVEVAAHDVGPAEAKAGGRTVPAAYDAATRTLTVKVSEAELAGGVVLSSTR